MGSGKFVGSREFGVNVVFIAVRGFVSVVGAMAVVLFVAVVVFMGVGSLGTCGVCHLLRRSKL